VLAGHLIPRLLAVGAFDTLEEAMAPLAPIRGHRMAKAGIEMALLDALLRTEGRSLSAFLGATASCIVAGANVSIGTPDAVLASVAEAYAAGYRRVKCKIAPGQDLDSLSAVREAFPDVGLSADANGAYDWNDDEHRSRLIKMDALGLMALEQPLDVDDLVGHRDLAAKLVTPVMLDESVTGLASAALAIELGACDAISVKPARLGGIAVAAELHSRCTAAGVELAIGGMLESGIGRAAALAVAAMPGFSLPGDLGASERYFDPDLTAPHELRDGALWVPVGPGLGVEVDRSVIDPLVARKRTFSSS
jgi:O-succinylbenzoate synthase